MNRKKVEYIAFGDYIRKAKDQVHDIPVLIDGEEKAIQFRIKSPSPKDSQEIREVTMLTFDSGDIAEDFQSATPEQKKKMLRWSHLQNCMTVSACVFYPKEDPDDKSEPDRKIWETPEDAEENSTSAIFEKLVKVLDEEKVVLGEGEAKS